MRPLSRFSALGGAAVALLVTLPPCGCSDGGGGTSLPKVGIEATDPFAAEEGPDPATFTFTRTGDLAEDLAAYFSFAAEAGQAENGVDYTDQATGAALGTTVTIPAGAESAAITVVPVDDADVEGRELLTLTLSYAPGYTVAAAPAHAATATITDNEAPQEVRIEATDSQAAEEGQDTGTFTVTRTGDTTDELVVSLAIAAGAGQAENGVDYTDQTTGVSLASTVSIPAGSASATVTIVPVDDDLDEGPEAVTLTLVGETAYSVAAAPDDSAAVTVADNDAPPPEVTIRATDAAAAEQGRDPGTFTVTRVGDTTGALAVSFNIAEGAGQAENGVDYTEQVSGGALGTSVTIPDGSASATVTIVPADDGDIEGPEDVKLTLAAGPGYTVGVPGEAVVTIADNDTAGPPPMAGPFEYGPEAVTTYTHDGSDFVEETRKTYSYDAGGKVVTILEEAWDGAGGQWVNSARTGYAYNPDDSVDAITTEAWSGAAWNLSDVTTCSYSAGRMTLRQTDDPFGTPVERTVFTHTGGLVTREQMDSWDSDTISWLPAQAMNYGHDGASRLSSGTIEMPDFFTGDLTPVGTLGVMYDAAGRLSSQTMNVIYFLFTIDMTTGPVTYDATGRLQTMEMQVAITGEPPEHSLTERYYGADGRLQEVMSYDWDDVASDWVLSGKTTVTNTDAGCSFTFEHESPTPIALWPVELYGCGDVNPHLW